MPATTDGIESTIFYGDLSPEEKARIVTIGGKKVLPEPSGNKIVSMEPIVSETDTKIADKPSKQVGKVQDKPVVKDKTPKVVSSKTPKAVGTKPVPKPLITPDDEDATNDADGASPGAGDTKEGTATTKSVNTAAKSGTSFKVQIASLGANEKFVATKYDFAAKLGATIETEPGPNGVGTRILANPSAGTADAFIKKLKSVGKDGFKVKYANGVRL
jgi:outer membrane biosynthesis protein TonB